MSGDLILPLILQAAAMGVIIAEILLPSGGLLAIISAGLLGYSLYLVFATVSVDAGMLFLVADLIILPIVGLFGLKLLSRSPFSLRSSLSKASGVHSYDEKLSDLVGSEGVAVSDLRPSGTVKIDGQRVDVVTRGDYIEKSETVVVSKVEGSRVVVRRKPQQ